MDKCPKCGSTNREEGDMVTPWTLRYRRKGAFPLSGGKEIVALACLSCGHIELLRKDIADTAGVDYADATNS